MTPAFEGDLVRPLGLMTLHAAYAEAEVDELIGVLPAPEPFHERKRQWPVGRKLEYAQALVRTLKVSQLAGLLEMLENAKVLFKQRNELVHGRLFARGRLVSNRHEVPVRHVSPEDIVALADRLFALKERLWIYRCKELPPLLSPLDGRE